MRILEFTGSNQRILLRVSIAYQGNGGKLEQLTHDWILVRKEMRRYRSQKLMGAKADRLILAGHMNAITSKLYLIAHIVGEHRHFPISLREINADARDQAPEN
jgi:hypothetical protein